MGNRIRRWYSSDDLDESEILTESMLPLPSVKMRHFYLWDRNYHDEDDDEPENDVTKEDDLYDEMLDLKDMSSMMS